MNQNRPYCLSIAGYDPSGGAGILADIKTFESHKVLGMGVATCLTFQNDTEFTGLNWFETDEIIRQLEVLSSKFIFDFVKIGMIRDFDCLEKIVDHCLVKNEHCKIIWDPILQTTANRFTIHENVPKDQFLALCKKIFLVTPNTEEISILMNNNNAMEAARELSPVCNVFLKGGHNINNPGKDYLFLAPPLKKNKEGIYPFRPKKNALYPKHGSGCVVSSAITANLARGETLLRACLKGKDYVSVFLQSSKLPLGYHKI